MQIISKIWPGLSLAIIALLVFLLLRGCNQSIPAASNAKAAYDSAKRQDSPIIAGLMRTADTLRQKIDTLTATLVLSHEDLQIRKGNISSTLINGSLARHTHDTAWIIQNCDSLRAQIISDIPAVEHYAALTDSLIAEYSAKSWVQDSIIKKQQHLLKVADTTIAAQQFAYDFLKKDDQHKTAQLRIYKPVAVISGGVILAIIVLKSLIH